MSLEPTTDFALFNTTIRGPSACMAACQWAEQLQNANGIGSSGSGCLLPVSVHAEWLL